MHGATLCVAIVAVAALLAGADPATISLTTSGMLVSRTLQDPMTKDQLGADPLWFVSGSAFTYGATRDYYQDALGMHLGSAAITEGSWLGIYATTRSSGDVAGCTMTVPFRTVPANHPSGFHVTAIYTQTSIPGRITYVMCGAVTSSSQTVWEIDWMYEDPETHGQTRTILWTDPAANQPLTRTCAIVTNGDNYLKVYLDGQVVYENSAMMLGMTKDYYIFIETQTNMNELFYGIFKNFFLTATEFLTVNNLPAGGTQLALVAGGNNRAYWPISSGASISVMVGQFSFPLLCQLVINNAAGTTIAASSAAVALAGGDVYTVQAVVVGACTATTAAITVDGDFSDWSAVPVADSVATPTGVAAADWWKLSVALDASFIYAKIELYQAAPLFADFNTHVFFDTDDNAATGYQPSATSGFGSEFMVESGAGYTQASGNFNTGAVQGVSWSIAPGSGSNTRYELRVSRTARDAAGVLLFPSSGGCVKLVVQDNRNTLRTLAARLSMGDSCPGKFAAIAIDGNTADWSSIAALYTGASTPNAPMDITSISAANDANYLYLRIRLTASSARPFTTVDTHVFIDVDGNDATGYGIYDDFGSEFMIEASAGYDQRNGAWNAGAATAVNWSISPDPTRQTGKDFEFRISRAAKYPDGSAVFAGAGCMRIALQDNRDNVERVISYRFQSS